MPHQSLRPPGERRVAQGAPLQRSWHPCNMHKKRKFDQTLGANPLFLRHCFTQKNLFTNNKTSYLAALQRLACKAFTPGLVGRIMGDSTPVPCSLPAPGLSDVSPLSHCPQKDATPTKPIYSPTVRHHHRLSHLNVRSTPPSASIDGPFRCAAALGCGGA